MAPAVDESQRAAAKVVGVVYLLAMALAMFSEGYVRGTLVVAGDAELTARNILAHKQLFRLGVGVELVTFAADVTLVSALYAILAPVNRHLAVLAAFLRLVAAAVMVMMSANGFDALRLLSGADYLRAFEPGQLAALVRLSLGAHNAAYGAGFFFLGLGSAVFAYLWLRSSYVPKMLASLGVFASLLLGVGALAVLMVPGLSAVLYPGYMVPMFFFEVGMGAWLLSKGLRRTAPAQPVHA